MTRHRADLPPSGFAPAEVLIPVYLHVQSRRAGKNKGEAKAPGHVDVIEVTAWRWGAQAGGAMNGTAAMGRSQCTYRASTIHKRIDTATTALMWALARNDELREVRLTVRRPVSSDGVQEDAFTLTRSNARVVAFDQGAAVDGSTHEVVTLKSKVVQTHDQSGKPRTLVVAQRLPAPPPAQKAVAPAPGMGSPGSQVARDAGVKGGVSVTRLGSKPRGLVGLTPAEQPGRLAKAGNAAKSAATRAQEIQGSLNPRTQRGVTTAVTETAQGVRVLTSSEGVLRPAQRAALQAGEVAGVGARGVHAEVNGVRAAREVGLTPTGRYFGGSTYADRASSAA